MAAAAVGVVGAWKEEFDLQTYAPTPHSVGVSESSGLCWKEEEEKGERRRRRRRGRGGREREGGEGGGGEREGEEEGKGGARGREREGEGGEEGRGEMGRERGRGRRSLPVEVFLHPNLLQQSWFLHVCKVMENKTKLSDQTRHFHWGWREAS